MITGKIVLIILLANTGGARNEERRVYFNDLSSCVEVLKSTKLVNSTNNQWIGAATCGAEDDNR